MQLSANASSDSGVVRSGAILALVRFEINCDLGLDFDGRTIQVVWLVSPLADSFQRSAGKNGVAFKHSWIRDAALFVNRRFDQYRALGVNCERGSRILWLYALDQKSPGYALGDLWGGNRKL